MFNIDDVISNELDKIDCNDDKELKDRIKNMVNHNNDSLKTDKYFDDIIVDLMKEYPDILDKISADEIKEIISDVNNK